MNRREFIALIGGTAAAWPLAARAQQRAKVWRVGFLAGASRPAVLATSIYGGFLRGMREIGLVEGKDFSMEWRFAEGRFELLPELAAELVRQNVDVIVLGTGAAVPAARDATKTIPIVMASAIDPVGRGFVASLAHPGGNITGLASSLQDTYPKQVALLTMALPELTRIGAAVHPDSGSVLVLDAARAAAEKAGRELVPVKIRSPDEVASAFATLADQHVGAIMVITSAFFISQRERIAEIARRLRMPTIFAEREYMEAGGLMSYGESISDFYRRAAFYVDKIFKGAKPSELPVQQPTRFFLAINRKTADAIGFTIPLQLLVAADEVIE
jgi:putative ABC transport system substrate-binding protein